MPAKIIVVFNQKGGCGKTNTSMQLAGTLPMFAKNKSKEPVKSLLIDMDEQGTATQWAAQAEDDVVFPARVSNLSLMGAKVYKEIKEIINSYDFIVIDCPPGKNSDLPINLIMIADLVIVPVCPSPSEVWAIQAVKKITNSASVSNEKLLVRYLINRWQPNISIAREVLFALENDPEITLMDTKIGDRTAFEVCQINGSTVHQVSGAIKAQIEIKNLTIEVLTLLGCKHV